MERAVSSADLLSIILSHVDRATQARSARVSRAWFNPAIRNLWTSLDDVLHLICLLSKLRYHKDGLIFSYEADSDGDWERFYIYNKYVRRLEFKCTEDDEAEVTHNTLSTLAYTRSVAGLLPNLTDLTIYSGPHLLNALFFLHEGLKNLTIHDIDDFSLHAIFKYVFPRLNGVRSLHLNFSEFEEVDADEFEKSFLLAFQAMARIEEISMTELEVTQNMISCFATLPRLRKLNCHLSDNWVSSGDHEITELSDTKLINSKTSTLEVLKVHSTSEIISRFLSLDCDFSNMETLSLEFVDLATEMALRKGCTNLVSRWQFLSHLQIKLQEELRNEHNSSVLLSYNETFRCLSNLHQLRSFEFYYDTPLVINNDELDGLLANWPQLERFIIRSDMFSAYREHATLTLHSIELFANNCKNLKELDIHLDATQVDSIESQSIVLPSVLENLEMVAFRLSPIEDEDAVAVYLSQFITSSCASTLVDTVVPAFNTGDFEKKRVETMRGYKHKWECVWRSLQSILKVMERERKHSALRLENSRAFG